MNKGKIETYTDRFIPTVYSAAKREVKPEDTAQMVWFMRHAFRMGWNAAKQDSRVTKRKQAKATR